MAHDKWLVPYDTAVVRHDLEDLSALCADKQPGAVFSQSDAPDNRPQRLVPNTRLDVNYLRAVQCGIEEADLSIPASSDHLVVLGDKDGVDGGLVSLDGLLDVPVKQLIKRAVGAPDHEVVIQKGAAGERLELPLLAQYPFLARNVRSLDRPVLDMFHAHRDKVGGGAGAKLEVQNLGLISLAAALEFVALPVVKRYAVVVVRSDTNQSRAVGAEVKAENAALKESRDGLDDGASGDVPNDHKRALAELARGDNVPVGVDGHGRDVVRMSMDKLLSLGLGVQNDAKPSGVVGDFVFSGVLDVGAVVPRGGITVDPREGQVVFSRRASLLSATDLVDGLLRFAHALKDRVVDFLRDLALPEGKRVEREGKSVEVLVHLGGHLRFGVIGRSSRSPDGTNPRLDGHELVAATPVFELHIVILLLFNGLLLILAEFLPSLNLDLFGLRILVVDIVLPLEDTIVPSAGSHEELVPLSEPAVGNVRAMPPVLGARRLRVDARKGEELHEAEIVSSHKDVALFRAAHHVDVCAVRVGGPNALHRPAEGAGPRVPLGVAKATGAANLLASVGLREQQLVATAIGLQEAPVSREVQVRDVAVVLVELGLFLEVSEDVIEVNGVVLRPHGKRFAVGRELEIGQGLLAVLGLMEDAKIRLVENAEGALSLVLLVSATEPHRDLGAIW
mmetsp:Transcript_19770/g.41056  ORF Transcript_19770/g.41056 Transcript_19770/m.41056 type:complete len:676 (-) Transcript_19770:2195-4222(-)